MLLICHKIPVRLLNHFIQHFFWGDTTTSGNTFKLFVDFVTNGAIVIHTQRLKSDPGGNLLS
ncbi:hypothetical protein EA247_24570 [Escherichia coli]|nr:hypothetical protein DLJ63_05800 [Escherichia coli]KAA1812070.1 hypothetical protein EA164_25975 [Escherichia coli]KAA1860879.1 hypothetical protein EA247_24570 [Escherichia coli]OXK78947.1 hypothetical protein CD804_25075 [Escherichia coli]OYK43629.1 hypothetical protein CI716_17010 [Escherichia coli]